MTFVTLRIYKFFIFDIIPEYHAEISAYGKSFSYSNEGLEISMLKNKHGIDGFELIKTINLGFSGLSGDMFMERYFPELVEKYTLDKYKLFTNNCRHYSLHMIHVLRPSRPEEGLTILSDLNTMSELLGKAKDLIVVNLIRSLVANPMEKLQFLINLTENGRLFKSNMWIKDVILIINCLLLVIFWINRARL